MGRQAYLTRLALGRSAFLPPEPGTFPVVSRSQASTSDASHYVDDLGRDVQLYDERGHPANPKSVALEKAIRQAQNDVLASIGVLERKRTAGRRIPSAREDELHRQTQEENGAGMMFEAVACCAQHLIAWTASSFQERLIAFYSSPDASVLQLLLQEWQRSGPLPLVTAGLMPNILYAVLTAQSIIAMRLIDQLVLWARFKANGQRVYRRCRSWIQSCIRIGFELLSLPLLYHSQLQSLHLIPRRPFQPPRSAFIPFSALSPIQPISLPSHLTVAAAGDLVLSLLTQPALLLFLECRLMLKCHSIYYPALMSEIRQPDCPDAYSSASACLQGNRDREDSRRRTPPFVSSFIKSMLRFLGLGKSSPPPQSESLETNEQGSPREPTSAPPLTSTADIPGDQTGTSTTSPRSGGLDESSSAGVDPMVQLNDAENRLRSIHQRLDALNALADVDGPISREAQRDLESQLAELIDQVAPLAIRHDQDGGIVLALPVTEPRVRITDSDDALRTIEIELPAQPVPVQPPRSDGRAVRSGSKRRTHRVTSLSKEPARSLVWVLEKVLRTFTVLPLRVVMLRMVATRFLSTRADAKPMSPWIGVRSLRPDFSRAGLRSSAHFMGQLILFGTFELAVDLGFCGVEWLMVSLVGQRMFGWRASG